VCSPAKWIRVSKFRDAKIIEIDNYKEVFSSNNQDFHLQKLGQNLILASNKPNMIYEGAVVCEDFENDNFYYTSSIINCVYDCEYCYLQGVYSSGNIVIFVDIEKVFEEVEELYNKLKSLYLCVSYDTDLLAIENICSFSEKWYHFIKDKKDLKIELRTKSGNIDKFLNLDVLDNFIIAFTLSPEEIALKNEKYTASFKNRVKAIKELQNKGWKVRICIDPLIYTDDFEKKSNLKAKQSKLPILFYFIFPLITLLNQTYLISVVIIILCFLSVLDILYYLTDIRYLAILFLLTLYKGNLETFYFTVLFFIFIHFFSIFLLKKEGFGLGDSLLLITLSPLFTLDQMLQLVLIASVLGITYCLAERYITSQKRQKLPFIPFISMATFIIIYLN